MANPRYCFWNVAEGPYGALMEQCVASARRVGIFKEFHVFTDRPLKECECYDTGNLTRTAQLFKLIYLQAGMSQLLCDYFIWIDADSIFVRNPKNVLDVLHRSPIHVPLSTNLSSLATEHEIGGIPSKEYVSLMKRNGVINDVFLPMGGFWIVHHDAIGVVCDLSRHFLAVAQKAGYSISANLALGYAMQMLCGNPERHLCMQCPELWASDDLGHSASNYSNAGAWEAIEPITLKREEVNPAIIHVPKCKTKTPTLA